MALQFFSPEAQAALDLAKQAVAEGEQLTCELLMAAAYQVGDMDDELPQLVPFLPAPPKRRKSLPGAVAVAPSLQPVFATLAEDDFVTIDELMAALVDSEPGRAYLAGAGMPPEALEEARQVVRGRLLSESARRAATGDSEWRSSEERRELIKALATFGRMLTDGEPPHKGVVEMEVPLRRLQKTLVKMKRRNVIIIGHPGTGKTALVYEFARRLVVGDPSIAPRLRDYDIFELSPSFLRSGASMVGQYDERVSALIKLLEARPKVIMFVDEVHSLLQSGMHERGPFTEANEAFKQALGRGTLSIIGATTTAEYRHYIAPDQALVRRFGLLKIEAPSRDATLRILRARLPRLEAHFAPLRIPEEMLARAVDLTDEYLPIRFQPDKSIQLLDEACALLAVTDPAAEGLTEQALLEALEDTIGHGVLRPETVTVETALEHLKAKIVGQDEALESIARSFVAGLSRGWGSGQRPMGVFFFCGPTGVGKTETALQLSKLLGAGREVLLRVDCNTLGGHSTDPGPIINQLLGVPPGYIGYSRGQGGVLSKIRDMPEAVVLFDEIEKANPAISEILLQILDEGRVHDSDDNLLDFRRSFIIFTTNAGTTYERSGGPIGFGRRGEVAQDSAGAGTPRVEVSDVLDDLRRRGYGEEFFGRNIDFIVFKALDGDAIRVILQRQLDGLHEIAELRGYRFEWEPAAIEHLASRWQPRFGVRHLTTILRHRIIEQLAVAEVQGELAGVETIRLEVGEGEEVGSLATRRREDGAMIIRLS